MTGKSSCSLHVPVGPVNLEQIDAVGLQALQAALHALCNLFAGDTSGLGGITDPGATLRVAGNLRPASRRTF